MFLYEVVIGDSLHKDAILRVHVVLVLRCVHADDRSERLNVFRPLLSKLGQLRAPTLVIQALKVINKCLRSFVRRRLVISIEVLLLLQEDALDLLVVFL